MNEVRRARGYIPMVWRSYAKINLYLDVLHLRRDGFHNIETLFQTVGLWDELSFLEDEHVSMTCSGAALDTGETNLVRRAASLLQKETHCRQGVRIHLEKRIPIAAGLAGGSGNAAATLLALNKLWDLKLSQACLARLARVLGSDVPYCLRGGAMEARLRGEDMKPLAVPKSLWFVLAHPPAAVSAAQVYNHALLEKNSEKPFAGRTPSFRRALTAYQRGDMRAVVFNRMEAPVFADHPTLAEIKRMLLECGCIAAAMSGSGPTLFGICESQREALRIQDRMQKKRLNCSISIAPVVPVGVEQIR